MSEKVETKCPLCGTPRPPRVKRCVCNYTFEYERRSEPNLRAIGRRTTPAVQASANLAVALAAGFLAFFYMRDQKLSESQSQIGFLLVPVGLFCLAGAHFNWRFFMGSSRASKFVFLLGSAGARVFYAALGGALAGGGLAMLVR